MLKLYPPVKWPCGFPIDKTIHTQITGWGSCKENSYQTTISLNMWIMRRSFNFQSITRHTCNWPSNHVKFLNKIKSYIMLSSNYMCTKLFYHVWFQLDQRLRQVKKVFILDVGICWLPLTLLSWKPYKRAKVKSI